MMKNDKVSVIVQQIKQLSEQNSQFATEMQKLFGKVYVTSSLNPKEDKKIASIHELCIKKIIQEQACKFYEGFPIPEIKDKLVGHFVQMENFKRWDDFDHYCSEAFQQIELIVSWLCRQENFVQRFKDDFNKTPFTNKYDVHKTVGSFVLCQKNDTTTFVPLDSQEKMTLQNKWRYVLYVIHFPKGEEKYYYNTYPLNMESDSIYELYQCRNRSSHPDTTLSDKQKNALNKVDKVKYRYYLRFSSVLTSFIEEVYSYYESISD